MVYGRKLSELGELVYRALTGHRPGCVLSEDDRTRLNSAVTSTEGLKIETVADQSEWEALVAAGEDDPNTVYIPRRV